MSNKNRIQIANGMLLLTIGITITSLIHFQFLRPSPNFFSLIFKAVRVETNLTAGQTIALKSLMETLNHDSLKSAVLNGDFPRRTFMLVVSDPNKLTEDSDYFTFAISPDDLTNVATIGKMEVTIKERLNELASVSGLDELNKEQKKLVWIGCEPPSFKKISGLKKQIRKVLFLQICDSPDKSLVMHLRTNQIEKYLRENKTISFAVINFKSWSMFEKWHGDLWKNTREYSRNAGVTSISTNEQTQINHVAAAIDVIESFRGVDIL